MPPGTVAGNTSLQSEVLIAYEMGYRVEPTDWLSFDISGFYNNYNNLMEPYFPPDSFQGTYEQFQKAQTYGVEPSFKVQVQPWWKINGSYSLLAFHTDNSGVPMNVAPLNAPLQNIDPQNEFSLRSSFDLPHDIDLDLGGRYVDKTVGANGYYAVDFRVGWRPSKNWEVSVVGQNLLSAGHIENPGSFDNATYVGPEVYGKVVFKF
jgi:iron complex outermembrane receptor protein